ncbi:hypothetical protein [Roseiflexus sp.]
MLLQWRSTASHPAWVTVMTGYNEPATDLAMPELYVHSPGGGQRRDV